MASLISPGIVIKERDLSNAVVVNAQSIVGGFASTFQRGPVGEIVTIGSQKDFLDIFGKPTSQNAEDWFVASEFLNYGGRLAVVRAETNGLNSANSGSNTSLVVGNDTVWQSGVGSGETWVARTPGAWGNSLRVIVADRGSDQIITISSGWDNTPVIGSLVSFNTSSGVKTAEVSGWNASTRQLTVVLDDPTTLISTSDTLEDGDEIGTFTYNAAADAARTPGTYLFVDSAGGGASFNVTIADAGGGVGGAVTVQLVNPGDGYTPGQTITIPAADIGGTGADLVLLVSTLDPDTTIEEVRDWWSNTSVSNIPLSSIGPRPGTSQYASDRGLKYDEIHVAIVDATGDISGTAGTIIERLTYLSKLTDAKGTENQVAYYKTAINEGSAYVYTGATITGTISPSSSNSGEAWGQASGDLTSGDMFTLSGATSTLLADGEDDYAYSAGEIVDAYEVFTETEETEIDFVLMGGSMSSETDTRLKAAGVMSVAQTRKDCVAFVSPHKGNQVGSAGALTRSTQKVNTINFFNALSSTSYAVFDSGYKYMYDRFNDTYRWIPCNGDVAGLCVSTSATLDDWYSPAGTNRGGLRNAVKLAFNPTQSDRDELYQARINPIVSFPGSGVILFGDKTALASPSAFDRINVRRLFLNIQKRAETLAKGVLFEQNDATTRIGFASALNSYLAEVQARRGVTDFLVVCDETNNTPSVVDRNEFVAEIYIKPTRSINYITVTLTATKTGVSFAEVVGG